MSNILLRKRVVLEGGWKPGNLAQEPPEPEMHRMRNILLRKQGGGWKPGNLAQEPPEPEMHRMSYILLRKRAVLDRGLETWKSGPGAARARNAPDDQ